MAKLLASSSQDGLPEFVEVVLVFGPKAPTEVDRGWVFEGWGEREVSRKFYPLGLLLLVDLKKYLLLQNRKTLQIIMIFYCHVSFWVCAFLFFPHLSKPRIREGAPNCLVEWGFPLNSWNWRDLPRWRWFRHCFFVKLSFTSQSPT